MGREGLEKSNRDGTKIKRAELQGNASGLKFAYYGREKSKG